MALTESQRQILRVAMGNRSKADAVADMIDAGGNPQGAAVTDLSAAGAAGTDAAIIDNANAKIDELLGSLRAVGIIA